MDHIFVYYQKPFRTDPDTGEIRDLSTQKEFVITDGSNIKLRGYGIYFVRTNSERPINEKVANDEEVLFGEVSEHSVNTLNTTINSIYKPMIENLTKDEWGVCEAEQKQEFGHVFDKFANELNEALRSIQGNVQLDPFPSEYEATVKQLFAGNHKSNDVTQMIDAFLRLLDRWFFVVQETLDGHDTELKDGKDAGPRQELDYWKMRMRKLTGISEQLRSKNCRTVHDSLKKYHELASDSAGGRSKDSIYLQTSKWRAIELRVTEALNEAKDNVKYLQTLEKFIEPLETGSPESIREILPAMMNSIKMIHTIARYYNTTEQMTGLLAKITTSMIKTCARTIMNVKFARKGEAPKKGALPSDSELWQYEQYPPDDLVPVLQACIELNNAFQHQYNFTKERLRNMPKGKQFDFSTQQIFGRFDLFCRRVQKLTELFSTIQQFRTLGQHKLEGIDGIIAKFNKHVQAFQRMNHKLLDFNQNTFDRDFVAFNVQISMVENDLHAYIQDNFERDMSILDYLNLLRKFKSILTRENLANSLASKYQVVFQHFGREI
jgi:dynein heavy chain, axonemal